MNDGPRLAPGAASPRILQVSAAGRLALHVPASEWPVHFKIVLPPTKSIAIRSAPSRVPGPVQCAAAFPRGFAARIRQASASPTIASGTMLIGQARQLAGSVAGPVSVPAASSCSCGRMTA